MISDLKQLAEYRELLRTLISKDIRSRYKNSVLGFAWNFVIPLLQLFVFWLLFGIIIKVAPPGNYPFAVFLFTGLLPWNFFANSLIGGAMAIIGNSNLVKKIYFPLQILPAATVLSQFVSLLLGMVVLAVVVVAFGVGLSWTLLLLPIPFAVELLLILGLVYFVACANVFYRDIEHILGIIIMAWMYLTPVLYPITILDGKPAWAQLAAHLNPLTGIINAYQLLILDHTMPDWGWLGYSAVCAIVMFVVGFTVFNRYKYRFEEEI